MTNEIEQSTDKYGFSQEITSIIDKIKKDADSVIESMQEALDASKGAISLADRRYALLHDKWVMDGQELGTLNKNLVARVQGLIHEVDSLTAQVLKLKNP